ncbi:hypothetical protein LTR70_006368 [Exophiala xenobiotica]|uniref:DUF3669 domain-containing protein n=1 Tax=Lithohypha guttulata TaxID=1690604 RepID=A0ABR0KLD5_9EURO|nr:hypothetical protein LTR24_001986 [Lithohypha guttulata]KAK5316200.1 hypothetical protein LTR70_006368 [Exophiala xenobiotica]
MPQTRKEPPLHRPRTPQRLQHAPPPLLNLQSSSTSGSNEYLRPSALHFLRESRYITQNPHWATLHAQFPANDQQPRGMLHMERIPPVPHPLQSALIDLYCPPHLREKAHADPANGDCLIRPYLGRIGRERTAPSTQFSLRNFNLDLGKMEQLGLIRDGTAVCLASDMGRMLAHLHWSCGVDARDVEVVFGGCSVIDRDEHESQNSSRVDAEADGSLYSNRDSHRGVHLWLLDFNQVGRINSDMNGVRQCIRAFKENDPYFPKPGRGPSDLWDGFVEAYLSVAYIVLGEDTVGTLPDMFIEGVTAMQSEVNQSAEAARRRTPGECADMIEDED